MAWSQCTYTNQSCYNAQENNRSNTPPVEKCSGVNRSEPVVSLIIAAVTEFDRMQLKSGPFFALLFYLFFLQ